MIILPLIEEIRECDNVCNDIVKCGGISACPLSLTNKRSTGARTQYVHQLVHGEITEPQTRLSFLFLFHYHLNLYSENKSTNIHTQSQKYTHTHKQGLYYYTHTYIYTRPRGSI